MTKIDFYDLPDEDSIARDHFACQLAEQAFREGQRVYIHTRDADHCQQLDELLWNFRDSSFVPHQQSPGQHSPVLVGHQDEPGSHRGLLINLGDAIPGFFSRFEQVKEIIYNDEARKIAGREHYRHYRDHGYPLQHHPIRQKVLTR